MEKARVKFWGVRGSIPTPLTSRDVEGKVRKYLEEFAGKGTNVDDFLKQIEKPFTYGGNTSCVEVRYGDDLIILDMGTGMRPLGNSLFSEMSQKGGLTATIIASHLHWDHIQGLPFFGPIYVNRATGIENRWHFFGGTSWQKTAEVCLKGQMDPPTFPVSWNEIHKISAGITFSDLHDMMVHRTAGDVGLEFGKLNHPQETYGTRFVFPDGGVLVYTTDNEPFDPSLPDPRLVHLAKGADLWVTDCQYTRGQYNGDRKEGGMPRHGWGHSYPEAVAATAVQAGVKMVALFHHDPASSDEKIAEIRDHMEHLIWDLGGETDVIAAYEGLELEVGEYPPVEAKEMPPDGFLTR